MEKKEKTFKKPVEKEITFHNFFVIFQTKDNIRINDDFVRHIKMILQLKEKVKFKMEKGYEYPVLITQEPQKFQNNSIIMYKGFWVCFKEVKKKQVINPKGKLKLMQQKKKFSNEGTHSPLLTLNLVNLRELNFKTKQQDMKLMNLVKTFPQPILFSIDHVNDLQQNSHLLWIMKHTFESINLQTKLDFAIRKMFKEIKSLNKRRNYERYRRTEKKLKSLLIFCQKQSLEIITNGKYRAHYEEIQNLLTFEGEKIFQYQFFFPSDKNITIDDPTFEKTRVCVTTRDPVFLASRNRKENALITGCDRHHPGNKWKFGFRGFEESLMRRSNFSYYVTSYFHNTRKWEYPIKELDIHFCKFVAFFRNTIEEGLEFYSKPLYIDILSIARPSHPQRDIGMIARNTLRKAFIVAVDRDVKRVVIHESACVSCRTKDERIQVSNAYRALIEEEFAGFFKSIDIVVSDERNLDIWRYAIGIPPQDKKNFRFFYSVT